MNWTNPLPHPQPVQNTVMVSVAATILASSPFFNKAGIIFIWCYGASAEAVEMVATTVSSASMKKLCLHKV
jgi:hypothetical protein